MPDPPGAVADVVRLGNTAGKQIPRRWLSFGDATLTLRLADHVDEAIHAEVVALTDAIRSANLGPDIAVVPAFATLAVQFDPTRRSPRSLARQLPTTATAAAASLEAFTHVVAVSYDGGDLMEASKRLGMDIDELVRLHTKQPYLVYAIGFLPGFAYLGMLDARLELPRRANVRRLPAGAVIAAGRQTAILPADGLTGWHHLGSTHFAPLDWSRSAPMALQVGDRVRFECDARPFKP